MKFAWALVAIACSASAADEEPKMTTLPTAELMAMKYRNAELRADNHFLTLQLRSMSDKVDEQEQWISKLCGHFIKVAQ